MCSCAPAVPVSYNIHIYGFGRNYAVVRDVYRILQYLLPMAVFSTRLHTYTHHGTKQEVDKSPPVPYVDRKLPARLKAVTTIHTQQLGRKLVLNEREG